MNILPVKVTVRKLYAFPRGIRRTDWNRINEGPLKRIGLLARKIEIQMIRKDTSKKQTPSKPGRPPKSRHHLHLFRQIFSLPDYFNSNVIVGHENLSGAKQTPMEIHEFGQQVQIKAIPVQKNRRRITDAKNRANVRRLYQQGRIKSRRVQLVSRTVKMPERKFAEPTTKITARRMPAIWANSVTSATVKGV